MKLKAYIGYASIIGASEGAVLIFDYTAKKAMYQFRNHWLYGELVEEFIDARVTLLKDQEWNLLEVTQQRPDIIENPRSCIICERWGHKLNSVGVCESCIEEGYI